MRRNGKKWMALLGLVFAAAAAAVSYGAQSGPGMDLVTAADGRTVREEDRDVLADPEITGDTDKILVVRGQEIAGYTTLKNTDLRPLQEHIAKTLKENGISGVHVHIFPDLKAYLDRVDALAGKVGIR